MPISYAACIRSAVTSPSTRATRPLQALVAALPGAAPDLMKPNGEELASFTGDDPEALEADPAAAAKAAASLIERGVGAVLATLGGNGAVLVTADGAWHATPPPTTVVSTVGAGDSSLFGYVLGDIRGLPAPERLALAVAYGSAAAGLPGTTIPQPSQLRTELGRRHHPWRQRMTELITTDLVTPRRRLGLGQARRDPRPGRGGRRRRRAAVDRDQLIEDAFAREATSATGLPGGIAIPHCRTTGVEVPTLAFARLTPGVDFGAKDGPADLAFLIAAPAGGDADHLSILTKLARALVKPAFTDALRAAETRRGRGRPGRSRARRARPGAGQGRRRRGCCGTPALPRPPPPAADRRRGRPASRPSSP